MADRLSTVFCHDEDICIRARGDFPNLTPADALLAAASDGTIAAADRWTLLSASTDFEGQGVRAGHVLQMRRPVPLSLYAVESAAGHALTLRRLGEPHGTGQPPAPAQGYPPSNQLPIDFQVATLDPQIEEASWDLDQRFGIDESRAWNAPALLYRLRDLRQACVLTVLAWQYTALSRFSAETATGATDVFGTKRKQYNSELSELLARIAVRWGPTGTDRSPTGRFSTRLRR